MGCGDAEATGLGFVCCVVINPCVLSTELIWAFLFQNFSNFTPPPPGVNRFPRLSCPGCPSSIVKPHVILLISAFILSALTVAIVPLQIPGVRGDGWWLLFLDKK